MWKLLLISLLQFIPTGAQRYAPVLVSTQRQLWADAPDPWTLGGLIEQETCYSLKHRLCWNPKAELKTSREYGFGLGQLTTAYRADGSVRFNRFEELRQQYQELRNWRWEDRYDPEMQLRGVVLMVRDLWRYRGFNEVMPGDRWAFTLSAYNGGLTGVSQDQTLCKRTAGCDPTRWSGHVQLTSFKNKIPYPGYSKSAYQINREYVTNVLYVRRDKYRIFWSRLPHVSA